jgi:hypothetical protein
MRMLKVRLEDPALKVADPRALEAGFLRWLAPDVVHELPDTATVRKELRKLGGGLVPADAETARLCGLEMPAEPKPAERGAKKDA